MNQSHRKRYLAVVLGVIALMGATAFWVYQRYVAFADMQLSDISVDQRVLVESGDSFATVLRKLRLAGVTQGHSYEWQVLARQLGAAGKVQVGEYALDPGITPRQLLLRMRDGKVISYRFTIVEGWNIRDLRAALARAAPLQQEGAQLDDSLLMQTLGYSGQHPEGRFLPETYLYTLSDSDLDILKQAHDAMDTALETVWAQRDRDLPLASKEEAIILASIVEKETGIASERPQIAGVFVRRLKRGMRLQTDPSVVYGLGGRYDGNIRRADLLTDTPYNTYTRAGLPPTPIAMPGADALHAATHPASGDTLYFVAVGDGSGRHVFTRTLAEHQRAVNDYVRRYRAQHPPQ